MVELLEFSNVSKFYGTNCVVDGVSFSLQPSTVTVLVGPNGAGKSTIAKMITGAELPTSGEIKFKADLRKSYVPQQARLAGSIPITCSYYAKMLNLTKDDILRTLHDIEFNMNKIWDSQLSEISSGQRQLFFIATAFAAKADLVILDEPTSFLDVDFEDKFYNRINDIKHHSKTSIFMISHDLHNVIGSADQVLCINHHICCSGKPFQTSPTIETNVGRYIHKHNHKHL